ncbi:MAG: RidA family protein [Alphaproteobacteria bacterium]|jgi:enamine deaminase RidA (YjgF/YER057c/UK114 family)|nr:RidA family protein [Alphaproteobacteria bacterium]
MKILQPAGWAKPKGYANGIEARGRTIYVAGQIGWNAEQRFETDDLAAQVEQTLRNTVAVLAEAGAGPEHIVRMTWYVVDKRAYLAAEKAIGVAYRAVIGRHFPVMTLVQVADLLEDRAKVEIETTAVIPD